MQKLFHALQSRSHLRLLALALCACASVPAYAVCDETTSFLDRACKHLTDTWTYGTNDVYIPFHTYHSRRAYTAAAINAYREDTWGIGYGRSHYDGKDNWDGLYVMAFLDSHSKPEYVAGYAHQVLWGNRQGLHVGLGYTAFLTARTDLWHYMPVPGILPIASINYNTTALNILAIPGGKGNGNILFMWTRVGF